MKLFTTTLLSFFAAALIGGIGGGALAADEPAGQPTDPAQKEQELAAALKKCDPLTGAEKQKCVDAAKKKFGQM